MPALLLATLANLPLQCKNAWCDNITTLYRSLPLTKTVNPVGTPFAAALVDREY